MNKKSIVRNVKSKNTNVLSQDKALQDELFFVQEMFEEYLENEHSNQNKDNLTITDNVVDEFAEILKVNSELVLRLEIMEYMRDSLIDNSIEFKLGNLLIESTKSFLNFIKTPFRLYSIWRQNRPIKNSKLVDGELDGLIKNYKEGDVDSFLEKIKSHNVSNKIIGDCLTKLSKEIGNTLKSDSLVAAKLAYHFDPKIYRLKWLAMKYYSNGDLHMAQTLYLYFLNQCKFSESEKRVFVQICFAADVYINRESKLRAIQLLKSQQCL